MRYFNSKIIVYREKHLNGIVLTNSRKKAHLARSSYSTSVIMRVLKMGILFVHDQDGIKDASIN